MQMFWIGQRKPSHSVGKRWNGMGKSSEMNIFFKLYKKFKKRVDKQLETRYTRSCRKDMGSQLSWESTCLTSRGSQVRALLVPLSCEEQDNFIWRNSSVGQSTRFIPVVSLVQIRLPLFTTRRSCFSGFFVFNLAFKIASIIKEISRYKGEEI